MYAALLGTLTGLATVVFISLFKGSDKKNLYGLVLTGIGFLYVGYTWDSLQALLINSIQAILFVFIAYYGMKKNKFVLAAGYFLHGIWDLLYDMLPQRGNVPPHYDLFCLSADFVIGSFLLYAAMQMQKKARRAGRMKFNIQMSAFC